MKKLDLQPNTPEWLEARANYRTASEAAIVMGISPFTTREKFKLIKAGLATQYYSQAMRQGHEKEAQIRAWANKQFNREFREEVWVNGRYLASVDGIDHGVIVEIKTSTHTFNAIDGGTVPSYYGVQIQQQLFCTGAAVAYLVAYCPNTDRYGTSAPIYPDPAEMQRIEAAWEEFDAMPLPEGDIDAADNLDLWREFRLYEELKRESDRIADELAVVRERILGYKVEGRNVVCNGYQIIAKSGMTKVDYKKAASDAKLDLSSYTTRSEPIYQLKMAPSPFEVDEDE